MHLVPNVRKMRVSLRSVETARGIRDDCVAAVSKPDVVVVACVGRGRGAEVIRLPVALRATPAVHHHDQWVTARRRGAGRHRQVRVELNSVEARHVAAAEAIRERVGLICPGLAAREERHGGGLRRLRAECSESEHRRKEKQPRTRGPAHLGEDAQAGPSTRTLKWPMADPGPSATSPENAFAAGLFEDLPPRCLRPSGARASLDFHVPSNPMWRASWRVYTRALMPSAGYALGGRAWWKAGRFLGPNIEEFYREWPRYRLYEAWREAGMVDVEERVMSLGGGLVMWGRKHHA